MGIFFSGSDLIEIAVGIENKGIIFYDTLYDSISDTGIKDIYRYLSGQEKIHMQQFQNMLGKGENLRPSENYTEEYDSYLKSLVDSSVFTDEKTVRQLASNARNNLEAIHIAIDAEKDSILFYTGLLPVVRVSDQELVAQIIEEEKSHLRQLTSLKRKEN